MKNLVCVLGALVAGLVFGAANDMVISFSTPGVDRYADGSIVKDGESYALVWTANGATFGGLSSDCRELSATDKLVLVAPLARLGRCPLTVAEIAAADTNKYVNGSFALYLLDTRVKGTGGAVTLASYRNGRPCVVNSFGHSDATAESVASGVGVAGRVNAVSAVRLGSVGVYSQIDAPEITAIVVADAQIRLEVKGMNPAADYFVVPGASPNGFAPAIDAKADATGFTFEKPEEPATFYKVIGVRKF